MRRSAMSYQDALRWMIDNDDTSWLDDDEPIISVTACFCADIYKRSNEEVINDLKTVAKIVLLELA